MDWLINLKQQFTLNFINDNRWQLLLTGYKNTIIITIFALLIGILIGVAVSIIRSTYDQNYESMVLNKNFKFYLLSFLDKLSKFYLAIIRGTPVVVQLLIAYFIIFAASTNGIMIAIIAFGINSGAYVAEILRGGIMSIDKGQFEAGRSLGFNYTKTMIYIIIPQVVKNVLPTLCNEFISLLKETSVAGYVGIMDLTKAGDLIRGRTFSAFMPLIAVALMYLVTVMVLTWAFGKLERKLRKNER